MNRFQFVADHHRRYGMKRLCTILNIARSSFYDLGMARGDLTDEQWVCLEAMLPPSLVMGRKPRDRRQVFDGIWWRARTGSPWRDGPERYGPWETSYSVFRRWQIDGTWARILEKLQVKADAAGHIKWEVSVDSTICRAHQHAAGARKRGITIRAGPSRTAWRPSQMTTPSAALAAA
ncbi:IS5 family transposase [Streptomyces murinus]|uniref:IS5 family transposase n=1 Tax=Streptomyces murinus TaxID=33900 RepID=UPI003F490148